MNAPEIPSSLPPSPTSDALLQIPTKWPKVIGIIGIALGGLAAMVGAMNAMGHQVAAQQLIKMGVDPSFPERHATALKVMPIASGILGLLLLIGSVLLLMRKSLARPILMFWALAKIGFSLWQAPISSAMQREMLPVQMKYAAQTNPEATKQQPEELAKMMQAAGEVISITVVIWYMALPLFILIWMMRQRIRSEVATWS
jgi:hypothetical protein